MIEIYQSDISVDVMLTFIIAFFYCFISIMNLVYCDWFEQLVCCR